MALLDRGCGQDTEQYDIREVLKTQVSNHGDKKKTEDDEEDHVVLSQYLRKARKMTAADLAAEKDEVCELGDLMEKKLKI